MPQTKITDFFTQVLVFKCENFHPTKDMCWHEYLFRQLYFNINLNYFSKQKEILAIIVTQKNKN